MHSPPSDPEPPSFSSSFQNCFDLEVQSEHFKTLSHSINVPCFVFAEYYLCLSIFWWVLMTFFLSRLLLIGTLCFCVLDHLVWSNHKRTEPGRDASLLQTDTSSKGCESANHAEVSSVWPEFKRRDSLSHFSQLIGCLAWHCYKWRNSNMFLDW